MRLLVFGAAGIAGRALVAEARRRGWPVAGLSRAECDICDERSVAAALAEHAPDLVVNCAAYTRVDDCEDDEAAASRVNDLAVGGMARACEEREVRWIHLSTDYVFDGLAQRPYDETAEPAPLSAYGRTKRGGERHALASPRALLVRTSALFGAGGPNFVDSIAGRLRRRQGPLRVVDDQVTAPTYAPFLARALADLGESATTGIVHYRNREPVSWYEFARAVARELASDLEIVPVPTAEFPRPARRPPRSVLAVDKFEATCGRRVEPWAEGLERHLAATAEERR
jgi:dTDP-4-dehydrorhamnose reductase